MARKILTFQHVYDLYMSGVMGTKEFRNWLAKKDDDFASVRDPDVDNQIDEMARRREQMLFPPPAEESDSDSALDSQS
jgi:hypothetical protein